MSTREPGIRSAGKDDKTCPATSPGGWHCCREEGHAAPHIGSTADWERLHMWGPKGGRWVPGRAGVTDEADQADPADEVYTYKDGRTIPVVPRRSER